MTDLMCGLAVYGYLREIVNVSRLQEVVDKFAKATGVAAIVADTDGVAITKPSNFSRFCNLVRSTAEGRKGCYRSDQTAGQGAAKWRNLSLHQCHCGLIDMAAPLILGGVYWGAVLCGQVLLEEPSREQFRQIRELARRFGLDGEKMVDALKNIEVVSESKIRAAGELLQIMANYIVEMNVSQIAQQRLNEQLQEVSKMERVVHQFELRALQSQINPHFLFNTLNAASRLALIEGAAQTERLIQTLAGLLRYTLRNIDKLVPLKEELDYISNYLFIQKTRYGDQIEVQVDTQPEVLDAMIPLMTLQPVVENAIMHGLEPKEDGGRITITARQAGDRIRIDIQDTGVGMKVSGIDHFLEGNRSGRGHTTGLGLSNAHRRLKYCFGDSSGVEISSVYGEGTTVTVWIPLQNEKSERSQNNT